MASIVCRVVRRLSALVAPLPIGTDRALLDLVWMLLSGRLLVARGAVIPAREAVGWGPARVRRAWAAWGQGAGTAADRLTRWRTVVAAEGRWPPHQGEGDRPVAVDVTGLGRPRLRACPPTHDHGGA